LPGVVIRLLTYPVAELNEDFSNNDFKCFTVRNSSKFSLHNEGRDLVGLDAGLRIFDWSLSKDGEDLGDAAIRDPDL
jgi:hypothetical protein